VNRVRIVGANGQLGRALRREFPEAIPLDRATLDIADVTSVSDFDWSGTGVVVNAAAWTRVDAAQDPAHLDAVRATNVDGVAALAAAAGLHGFTLVHVSSEYVFDGRHTGPMPEDLASSPLSVYGKSKADGDVRAAAAERHLIVRPTWLVGEGGNFVRTMASLADRGVSPAVVHDQIGRLTFAADLAAGIRHLLAIGAPFGTYNLTNEGEPASWADVAAAVFEARGRSASDVGRTSTEQYFADKPQAAVRPLNSVLDLSKIIASGFEPRDWRNALAEYLAAPS
jgi:dTDP-4-dehydrorhamnose reductase